MDREAISEIIAQAARDAEPSMKPWEIFDKAADAILSLLTRTEAPAGEVERLRAAYDAGFDAGIKGVYCPDGSA